MVSRVRPWLAVLTAVMLAGALAGPGSASARVVKVEWHAGC
jgi:hypothetical protein